jgi:hypothetical protein
VKETLCEDQWPSAAIAVSTEEDREAQLDYGPKYNPFGRGLLTLALKPHVSGKVP